jgi:hypothetical protein
MKFVASGSRLAGHLRTGGLVFGLLSTITQLNCSMPSLESAPCGEARDSVKEFYSWYLGTDPVARDKQLEFFDRYVSRDLSRTARDGTDPFFLSDSPPTTFKVGKCEIIDDTHVKMQVQLYWRGERKTDQKEVFAETAKSENKWLIKKVESR